MPSLVGSEMCIRDRYEAYEIFKTNYDSIAGDIELIQAEGKDSVRQVDPNMVIKKKNGKDTEVQEGWKGHIIPFELVQNTLLKDDVTEIENMRIQIQEISSKYETIISELSEDDLSLIHISEPTRLGMISYAVFCLKKKKRCDKKTNTKENIRTS